MISWRIAQWSTSLVLLAIGAAHAQPLDLGRPHRNILGFEILGRSGLAGIAYERQLTERFGAGIGGGSGWDIVDQEASGLVPIYVTLAPVGNRHRVFVGAGVALVHVSRDIQAFGWVPRIGWSTYRTVTVGYEHHGDTGVWRVTLGAWHQQTGVPGGVLNVREGGFFFMPGFFKGFRF